MRYALPVPARRPAGRIRLRALRRGRGSSSARASRSFLLLQEGYDGFARVHVLLFVEHHGTGDDRLRVSQVEVEMRFVPAKIRLIVARRIAEVRDAAGLATVDACQ